MKLTFFSQNENTQRFNPKHSNRTRNSRVHKITTFTRHEDAERTRATHANAPRTSDRACVCVHEELEFESELERPEAENKLAG